MRDERETKRDSGSREDYFGFERWNSFTKEICVFYFLLKEFPEFLLSYLKLFSKLKINLNLFLKYPLVQPIGEYGF